MTDCPSLDTLDQFLSGGLPAPAAAALGEHVRGCLRCPVLLDERMQWLAHTQSLADLPPERQALARLVQEGPPTLAYGDSRPEALSCFLGPAAQAGDLGTLGPYRILAELGRGGMGVVFKAYDSTLERTVALKLVRPDRTDARARQRLVREAQLEAQFRHDHVVTVYAVVNPADGPPYLVMEYVTGKSLAALIRARPRLEPAAAVAVAVQVADGLEAAHAAGLVHRDVKPGNILVEAGTGRAKIADFGLARAIAQPSTLTEEGDRLGTPAYMSPEQAREEPSDARADVYSLGVTLYEALTGELPFRGTPHRVLHQILHDEPRPLRQLNDAVPLDLETVCLKAMAKEPGRRYQSAGALADDLRRWQRGEPVHARPAGALERGWRWCRRNPRVAGLSAAVLGLLLLLVLGSMVATVQIAGAKAEAERRQEQAETAGRLAAQNAADARKAQAKAAASARAAGDNLNLALDTLNTLVGKLQDQLGAETGTLRVRRQLAETAVHGLEQIVRRVEASPSAGRSRVAAHDRLGGLFYLLGRTEEARRQFEQARSVAQTLLRTDPRNLRLRLALATAEDNLGNLVLYDGDPRGAAGYYRRALALRQALALEEPENDQVRQELCGSYARLGDTCLGAGDPMGALELYRTGVKVQDSRPWQGAKSQFLQAWYHWCLRLGNCYLALGGFADATAQYRQALAHAEAYAAIEPDSPEPRRAQAFSWRCLGGVSLRRGDWAGAEVSLRRSLAAAEALAAADPDNRALQQDVAWTYMDLGDAQGDLGAARASYQKALTSMEQLAGRDPGALQKLSAVIICCRRQALLDEREGHYAQALQRIEHGLAFFRRVGARCPQQSTLMKQARQDLERDGTVYTFAAERGVEDLKLVLSQPAAVAEGLLRIRALALAHQGHLQEAAATAQRLRQLSPENPYALLNVARVYAQCAAAPGGPSWRPDYVEAAAEALRAAAHCKPDIARALRWAPEFNSMRDHPVFLELARSQGSTPPSADK